MNPSERQLWRERIARALASLKNDDVPALDALGGPASGADGVRRDSRREPNEER